MTDRAGSLAIAQEFVEAVVWGEHKKVWDLFGLEARTTVLRVASKRGMDEGLAARLRDGTAADAEREEFLADLITGLRADLAGNDLDAFEYELDPEPPAPGQARVVLNVPIGLPLGGVLPVASVELSRDDGTWKIERMIPQVST